MRFLPLIDEMQNTLVWLALVLLVAALLGAIWALVDGAITYAQSRVIHQPVSPADRERHERHRLAALTDLDRDDEANLTKLRTWKKGVQR